MLFDGPKSPTLRGDDSRPTCFSSVDHASLADRDSDRCPDKVTSAGAWSERREQAAEPAAQDPQAGEASSERRKNGLARRQAPHVASSVTVQNCQSCQGMVVLELLVSSDAG